MLSGATKEEIIGGVEIATIAETDIKEQETAIEVEEDESSSAKVMIGPEFLQDDPLPDVLLRVSCCVSIFTWFQEFCTHLQCYHFAFRENSSSTCSLSRYLEFIVFNVYHS